MTPFLLSQCINCAASPSLGPLIWLRNTFNGYWFRHTIVHHPLLFECVTSAFWNELTWHPFPTNSEPLLHPRTCKGAKCCMKPSFHDFIDAKKWICDPMTNASLNFTPGVCHQRERSCSQEFLDMFVSQRTKWDKVASRSEFEVVWTTCCCEGKAPFPPNLSDICWNPWRRKYSHCWWYWFSILKV